MVNDLGAKRCKCKTAAPANEPSTPISDESLAVAVKALSVLAFFPSDAAAQTIIGDALAAMCASVEALRYCVRRACMLYKTWDKCGVPGLRQIVTTKYRPADGIEGGATEVYPDGLPPERPQAALCGPEALRLPVGTVASADDGAERALLTLEAVNRITRGNLAAAATNEEIAVAPAWLRELEGYK